MDDARYKHGVIATAIALSLAADAAAQSTPNAPTEPDRAQNIMPTGLLKRPHHLIRRLRPQGQSCDIW